MRIPRIDFKGWLFYPLLFNPFCWVIVIGCALAFLFFSWWQVKRDGKYWVITFKSPFEGRKLILLVTAQMILNTRYFNRTITSAHLRYLEAKYFSGYKQDGTDWRYQHNVDQELRRFENTKKREYGTDQ